APRSHRGDSGPIPLPGTVTDSEVNEEPGRDPGLRGCESLRSPQGRAVHWRDKRPVKPWLRLWEFESLPAHSCPHSAVESASRSERGGRRFESCWGHFSASAEPRM